MAFPSSLASVPSPLWLSSASTNSSRSVHIFRFASRTPPPSEPVNIESPKPSPSLSDQLRPLSLNFLKQTSPLVIPPSNPNPTWVNPAKPKPSVILPHRHRRSPHFHNPHIRNLLSSSLSSSSELASALDDAFSNGPPSHEEALVLLKILHPWQKVHRFFLWLQAKAPSSPLDTVLYNVTLKSLSAARNYDLAESLANEMIELGVPFDNITYSTLITCAKRCRRFDRALHWFDRIYRTGLIPDEVTYSSVLDVYAELGRREDAVALYERARADGWTPDPVVFSVLTKMFRAAADYDGIRYVLKEMSTLGVKPTVVVYNTLLEAIGMVGKPGLAKMLFEEMLAAGLAPDEKTLTALLRIYRKARWGRDALELWERMRANNWPVDLILYNALLSMFADFGLEEEAERLFDEMQNCLQVRPDNFTYTAMIKTYCSVGKVDSAVEMFDKMLDRGVEPSVMGCTCLIQCLGKAKRIDDAVRVFDIAVEKGIKPDDRVCGCLLSLAALCDESDMTKVLSCLERASPRLVVLIRMLGDGEVQFEEVRKELRSILNDAAADVRKPFCNCLIDICRNRGYPSRRARELLRIGTQFGLYSVLQANGSAEWSLNLRSLSVGAAKTAFEEWMERLSDSVQDDEAVPLVFSVCTGNGDQMSSQGLCSAFSSYLKELAAPFRQSGEGGYFVAAGEGVITWARSKTSNLAAKA